MKSVFEVPVGMIFEYKDVKLICIKRNSNNHFRICEDCYLDGQDSLCVKCKCSTLERKDRRSVKFVKIK